MLSSPFKKLLLVMTVGSGGRGLAAAIHQFKTETAGTGAAKIASFKSDFVYHYTPPPLKEPNETILTGGH